MDNNVKLCIGKINANVVNSKTSKVYPVKKGASYTFKRVEMGNGLEDIMVTMRDGNDNEQLFFAEPMFQQYFMEVSKDNPLPNDKDKIIFVFYYKINTDDNEYMLAQYENAIKYFDNKFDITVNVLVIPTYEDETHCEILNLNTADDEKVKELTAKADEILEKFRNKKD